MKVFVKKIHGPNKQEIGSILSVNAGIPTTAQQKSSIESQLEQYAHNTLYPGRGLNIYSHIESDTPSIVVIFDINNIDYTEVEI